MVAKLAGNGGNLGFALQINGNPATSLQRRAVQLQPSRRTAFWHAPIRDHDIRIGAGSGQGRPVDPLPAADASR